MADAAVDHDRQALIGALGVGAVAFVVIGGAGLQSHGQSYVTQDVDITPARSPANLARLAAILNKLEWRLVVDLTDSSQDVPVPAGYFTVASLGRQDVWNLMTAHGKLDITFTPSGFPTGYDELRRRAQCRPVANTSLQAPVAALEDIEHSKRVAGRPKDRSYLMAVGRLHPPPQIPRTRTP